MRMKEITQTAKTEHQRLLKSHLIVIDDIMLFPIEKKDAVNLFNFINQIYEKHLLS
jgi:DNA replication protein DnaC